mmetsp:Transcript_26745/g.58319  ORF Transcript_26745/g.58319 Transcript_26745/m.58319 type:complete len:399 (-) Transcript_26745:109-1305(-)
MLLHPVCQRQLPGAARGIAVVFALLFVSCAHVQALLPDPAEQLYTPWLLPRSVHLPYEGLESDLDALLRQQSSSEKWITVFMFNAPIKWWTMNCIYSYMKYGHAHNYVVAAPDEAALKVCLEMRVPCLDMTAVGVRVPNVSISAAQSWKSAGYYALVWAKVDLVAQILRRGYHVHFSDVDVVYLRDVWRSYAHVFSAAGPDAVFMEEQWVGAKGYVNMFNTGVYAIRSNPRSQAFMAQWYGNGSQASGNQPFINSFAHRPHASFAFCNSAPSCNLVKRRGRAALLLHAPQSPTASCPPLFDNPPHEDQGCHPDLLYIHYICSPRGWGVKGPGSKGHMAQNHMLQLLDVEGRPLYGPAAVEVDGRRPSHPFLPCPQPAAWVGYLPMVLDQQGQAYKPDA